MSAFFTGSFLFATPSYVSLLTLPELLQHPPPANAPARRQNDPGISDLFARSLRSDSRGGSSDAAGEGGSGGSGVGGGGDSAAEGRAGPSKTKVKKNIRHNVPGGGDEDEQEMGPSLADVWAALEQVD